MKMIKPKLTLFKCNQKKCGFKEQGCKACSECNAPPNEVSEKCLTCWDCENKDGALRWGDNTQNQEQKLIQKQKIQQEIPCIVG